MEMKRNYWEELQLHYFQKEKKSIQTYVYFLSSFFSKKKKRIFCFFFPFLLYENKIPDKLKGGEKKFNFWVFFPPFFLQLCSLTFLFLFYYAFLSSSLPEWIFFFAATLFFVKKGVFSLLIQLTIKRAIRFKKARKIRFFFAFLKEHQNKWRKKSCWWKFSSYSTAASNRSKSFIYTNTVLSRHRATATFQRSFRISFQEFKVT